MKKIILTLLAVLGFFAIYWFQFRHSDTPSAPKQEAIVVKKHSAAFNNSVDSLLQSYFEIKAAFVNTDSIKAKEACDSFILLVSRLNVEELKKDSAGIFESAVSFLNDIKSNAESLSAQKNITEMCRILKLSAKIFIPC